MDGNFDTLIYIIITIVAFVISALGKKKKKLGNQPVNSENYSKPEKKPFLSNLEQLLKEEMGMPDQNYQREYEDDSIKESYRDEYEMDEKIIEKPKKETIETEEKVPFSIEYEDTSEIFSNSIQNKDITKQEEELVIEDFNLRDAVIYSEIINRKEY
jgi:hypothetical protein